MTKVQTKNLSLRYHPKEDRMKLIINKESDDRIEFWITRRLCLSTLFRIDTYLESIDIQLKDKPLKKEQPLPEEKDIPLSYTDTTCHLLNNITFKLGKKKLRVLVSFFSDEFECETLLSVEDFLDFYKIMRSTFPKKEWGMI
jgi:hypothetical protein